MKKYNLIIVLLLSVILLFLYMNYTTAGEPEVLYIEPYLQNVTQNSISILWWTYSFENPNYVEYGEKFFHSVKAECNYIPSIGKYLSHAVISDLKPETIYKYRVRSGSILSDDYSFKTAAKIDSNIHFALLGDGRTDDEKVINRHRKITEMAMDSGIDFAIHAGDQVETGAQKHWERFWRQIATTAHPENPGIPFASNIPYYLVAGNHEIYNDVSEYDAYVDDTTATERFCHYVHNPPNGNSNPLWEERYYSFTYGPATFIILDTNNTGDDFYDNSTYYPDGSTPDWEPESEQYLWMIKELKKAQENSIFTFIVMHPSPYCRADHGDPKDKLSGYNLRVLDTVFRKYEVDSVLSSHDHLYERCLTGPEGFWEEMDEKAPQNLNYFVMGNSGHDSRLPVKGWETWMDIMGNNGPPYYTKYFYEWAGKRELASYLDVKIEKKDEKTWRCNFKVIRIDGKIFDDFYIERLEK